VQGNAFSGHSSSISRIETAEAGARELPTRRTSLDRIDIDCRDVLPLSRRPEPELSSFALGAMIM
jgi:hypothetical protein